MSFETYYRARPNVRAAIDALVKLSAADAALAFEASNNLRRARPDTGRKQQLEAALDEALARSRIENKHGRKLLEKKDLRAIARAAWGPEMAEASVQSTLSVMKKELIAAGRYVENETYIFQNDSHGSEGIQPCP